VGKPRPATLQTMVVQPEAIKPKLHSSYKSAPTRSFVPRPFSFTLKIFYIL